LQISALAEGSEEEFKNDRHLYGIKSMRNVGFGFWQKACLVTFT
jgi:phage major head subunit gpT-like protein